MSISVKNKARIIASVTVGGFIALIFIAMGCRGDYGVMEDERVSFESPPTTIISVETTPATVRPDPGVIALPAIVVRPDTIKHVTYKEAEAAFLARNYTEAVDLFTHYTRQKKNNAWGYYMLGLSAQRAGDVDKAIASLQTATTLDPRHIKSWTNLGRVFLEVNQPAKAIAALDEAVLLDPVAKDAYRLKGRAHHQQGEMAEAETVYRQALANNDKDAWSMNNLALVLIQQDRFDEALPFLALAIKIKDNAAVFHNNLGMVLENKGHYRAAKDVYAKAVELDASYTKAIINEERVAGVSETTTLTPINLSEIAENLAAEMKTWKRKIADRGE